MTLTRTIVKASNINPFDKSNHPSQYKFDREVIQLLGLISNISISIISTPLVTNLHSYEENPNTWVLEQIVDGNAVLSSTTIVLTPESPSVVKYSLAVGTFRPQLYYKARSIREECNIYLKPFSDDVWICLLCLMLIITLALTFILGRETRLPHNTPYDILARIADQKHEQGIDWSDIHVEDTSKESLQEREHWEVSEITLVTYGALCQQGSDRDPTTSAARILLLILFVLAVVSYTAYSASVISFISLLPETEDEIHPSDFKLLEDYSLHLQDTNFFEHKFEAPKNVTSLSKLPKGLLDAMKGKIAYIADRDVALTTLHKLGFSPELRCGLKRAYMGLEYRRVFVFKNNSGYHGTFNYNILRLLQFGILSRVKKRHFVTSPPCSLSERRSLSGFVSIDLSDVRPVLNMFLYGVAASGIILLMEYFVDFIIRLLIKIFGKSWTQVDERIEEVIRTNMRQKMKNKKDRRRSELNNEGYKPSFSQQFYWFTKRGTVQPPYLN